MRLDQLYQMIMAWLSTVPGLVGHYFEQQRPRIDARLELGEPGDTFVVCAVGRPLTEEFPQYVQDGVLAGSGETFRLYVPAGWWWLYAVEVEGGTGDPVRTAQIALYTDPEAGLELHDNPFTSSSAAQMDEESGDRGGRDADDP